MNEDILKLPAVIPPARYGSALADRGAPMYRAAHVMRVRNDALRQARDLLLPRLVSGEVDMEGLEVAGVRGGWDYDHGTTDICL